MSGIQLVWARPLAALALLLPVLLLLAARRRRRPPLVATGTLALWHRASAEVPPDAARRRPRPPLAVWLAAAALAAGALALAGPRLERPAAARLWAAVVDDSPSTTLPAPGGAAGDASRRSVALERAGAWLRANARPQDRVRWVSRARGERERAAGEGAPPGWDEPPAVPLPEPRWETCDAPGTLWVTDVAPALAPASAGVVASGAEPVPGPVAVSDGALVVWDGEELARGAQLAPRRVGLRGGALPAPLARFLDVWAAARGFVLDRDGGGEEPALVVERVPGPAAPEPRRIGRDGWRAWVHPVAASGAAPSEPGEEVWLALPAAEGGLPLVERAPGRVRVALAAMEEPLGDPAAFAASWARLLDASVLPPPGVVSLDERRAAGPARLTPPAAPPAPAGGAAPPPFPLAAALALAAALLALLAGAAGLSPPLVRSAPERPQSAGPPMSR